MAFLVDGTASSPFRRLEMGKKAFLEVGTASSPFRRLEMGKKAFLLDGTASSPFCLSERIKSRIRMFVNRFHCLLFG